MLNDFQHLIFDKISSILPVHLDKNKASVIQNEGYCSSPIPIHDIATSASVALGLAIEKIATLRGLEEQSITVDRRQAGMSFRSCNYLFLNGWHVDYSKAQSPISDFYQTKDGRWMYYAGAYPTIRKLMLDFLACHDNQTAIADKTKLYDSDILEEKIAALGGSACYCRTVEEWKLHPQGMRLLKDNLIQFQGIGNTSAITLSKAQSRPLEGIKVLDFTRVIAGPTMGRILAEQGADVIHVRHPYLDNILSFVLESSFGKKMVSMDYKHEQDKAVLLNLAQDADIILCGFREDAMEKAGLGEDDFRKINPNVVYVKLTGYGADGEWSNRKGWEQLAQTCSGIGLLNQTNNKPSLLPVFLCDYLTGYLGALGAITGLIARHKQGGTISMKLSLAKTAMFATDFARQDDSNIKPLGPQDFGAYLIDQPSHMGIFTRLSSPITFSKTPSYAAQSASFPGTHSLEIKWQDTFEKHEVLHYPSVLARLGQLRVGDYAKGFV